MRAIEELQAGKLEEEIAKIRVEKDLLRPTIWSRASDLIKVVGAVVATIIALAAAFTTYKITQLETKVAERDKADAERAKAAAVQERETAESARDQVVRDLADKSALQSQLEAQIAELEKKFEIARAEVARIPVTSPSVATSIAKANTALSALPPQRAEVRPFGYIVPVSDEQGSTAARTKEILVSHDFDWYLRAPLKNQKRIPQKTEIRYFRRSDREEALDILKWLRDAGLEDGKVEFVSDPDIERDRYFEVRFSQDAALNSR